MLKKCRDCGEEFQADEPWKVRCFPCWKEFKKAKDVQSKGETLAPGAIFWKARATALEQKINNLQQDLVEAGEHTQDLHSQKQRLEEQLCEFYEYLPRLIQLCHPDKHSGSLSAQKATQWLLEIRAAAREARREVSP